MQTTHTPGPWFADKLQDRNAYNVFPYGATHALVTVSASAGAPLSHSVAIAANARLIAAAPELLSALHRAAAALESVSYSDPSIRSACDVARAAIARATA